MFSHNGTLVLLSQNQMVDEYFKVISATANPENFSGRIKQLLAGEIVCIKVESFYSPQEIDFFLAQCQRVGFRSFYKSSSRYIGFSIAEYLGKHNGKKEYFSKIPKINLDFDLIFGANQNPTNRILDLIKDYFSCGLAFDPNYQSYYAPGIIEARKEQRLIHVDGARQVKDPCSPIKELSIALYLQAPDAGGELQIFDKEEESSHNYKDLALDHKSSELFVNHVCGSSKNLTINPNPGELMIFANCYYHQVLPSVGKQDRIAYLSTIYSINSNLVIWV